MARIDIETKAIMNDYSDKSLWDKIFNLYAEAEMPAGDKFQLSHLSFMMGTGTDPNAIKKSGSSTARVGEAYKTIDATQGDIKKLKDYDTIVKAINGAKLVSEATTKSKYVEQTQDLHDFLVNNTSEFTKGYKKNFGLTSKLIYRTLVISLIVQTSILSAASTIVLTSKDDAAKKGIDAVIEKTKGWKELFDRTATVMNDKDLKKMSTSANDIALKAEACDFYAESIASLVDIYSEVSLQDVAFLMKLGLAKIAYKVCGLLRFLIYILLVSKYSLEQRITEMKAIIAFSEKDINQRMEDEDKLMDSLVTMRVDDIKVMSEAEKDISELKIKEDGENKFAL